jgi:hypothetical protein
MFPSVTLVLASLLCGQPQERESVLFPPHVFLVHAKAVEVKYRRKGDPEGPSERGVFTIDRVYVGSDRLKGKQFHVDVIHPFGSYMGNFDYVRKSMLQQGEEGIWWIAENPNDKTLSDDLRSEVVPSANPLLCSYPPGFPYRDPKRFRRDPRMTDAAWAAEFATANAYYQSGVRWAGAIETVYRAKSEAERIDFLKKYAATKNSPTAAWAILSLSKVKPTDWKRFLPKLAENAELSVWSQTILDKELCQLEGRDWQRSPRRLVMLQRWVKREIPDPDQYEEGTSRIFSALLEDELDSSTFLRVFKAGMEGKDKLTKEQKSEFTALLEQINPIEDRDKRLLFDYLTELVQSSDAEVRKRAASGLHLTAPFDRQQLNILRKLGEMSQDSEVKRILDKAPYGPPTSIPHPERRKLRPSLPSREHKP